MKAKLNLENKNLFNVVIVLFLLIVIVVLVVTKYQTLPNTQSLDQENLKKLASREIDKALHFHFHFTADTDKPYQYKPSDLDYETQIIKSSPDHNAVIGKYRTSDSWFWLGWKEDNGSWKILVDLDGYDCKDLDTIPQKYSDFFYEQVHPYSPLDRKCFDWDKHYKQRK